MTLPNRLFSHLRTIYRRLKRVLKYPRGLFESFNALMRRSRCLVAWFKSKQVWDWLFGPSGARDSVFRQVRLNIEPLEVRQMPSGLSSGPITPAIIAGTDEPSALNRWITIPAQGPTLDPSKLIFEPNKGQAPASFDFVAQGPLTPSICRRPWRS